MLGARVAAWGRSAASLKAMDGVIGWHGDLRRQSAHWYRGSDLLWFPGWSWAVATWSGPGRGRDGRAGAGPCARTEGPGGPEGPEGAMSGVRVPDAPWIGSPMSGAGGGGGSGWMRYRSGLAMAASSCQIRTGPSPRGRQWVHSLSSHTRRRGPGTLDPRRSRIR
jgi:hypothetical protein